MRKAPKTFRSRAFSLIELLVVVAIIGLLASLAIPAFNSIGQARGVSEAAYQIASAVELARSEAISRQTFVWMGLQPQTNAGSLDLRVGLVYSKDGTATNTTASNLQPIGRALLLQRVGLAGVTSANFDAGTNLAGAADLSGYAGGMTFQIGQANFINKSTVTFSPLGEVTTNANPSSSDGFDPRIAIGLRQARGTTLMTNNDIAVGIDGSVGTPTIYRK
jgi:prepilin-type N-terminal cleavage/methylation domain-containing protein